MWQPDLSAYAGAIYEKIAAALESDIRARRLLPGARLPTLKELASSLGVTPGTVNRAYELAQRRALVAGEVGRGTFVLPRTAHDAHRASGTPDSIDAMNATNSTDATGTSRTSRAAAAAFTPFARVLPDVPDASDGTLDLSNVKPNLHLQEPYLRRALYELAQSGALPSMLDYTPDGGAPSHRQAGAAWMQAGGFPASAHQVLLTAGAQHGLWVAVNALTKPGDLVYCESLCYPGVASIVLSLGRRIRGVPLDHEGMEPNRLRALCQEARPALAICIATCQNPTTAVMSAQRRGEIAQIAREFDFILIDDDLYGFLAPEPAAPGFAPLATFAPERTVYLTSLSKSVAPTIRLGYAHCPPEWLPRMTASVRTSIWMVSPLAAQIATHLIVSGQAAEMAHNQREEACARQLMAREILGRYAYRAQPASFHVWLTLPPRWPSGEHLATLARAHQLLISGGDVFSVNNDGEGRQNVRIVLMASTRERMRFELTKLAGLIDAADSVWL